MFSWFVSSGMGEVGDNPVRLSRARAENMRVRYCARKLGRSCAATLQGRYGSPAARASPIAVRPILSAGGRSGRVTCTDYYYFPVRLGRGRAPAAPHVGTMRDA
ncbi:MAG: hypothetical protein PVS2B1_06520 [Candidatus Dormibacteraceae bacterium]